jgi:hypothetical protein
MMIEKAFALFGGLFFRVIPYSFPGEGALAFVGRKTPVSTEVFLTVGSLHFRERFECVAGWA